MNATRSPGAHGSEPTSRFVYKLIPPRASFGEDMTDAEAAVMQEHIAYWQRLTDEGKVVVFGPVSDSSGSWGLAVVEAETEDEVQALGRTDPAVKSEICTFEVGTMPVSIVRA